MIALILDNFELLVFWFRKMRDNSSPKQKESFKTCLGQKTLSLDHRSNSLIYIIISYKILIPQIHQIITKKALII